MFLIASPTSASSTITTAARLGQIRAQLELARNFYDDFEFCPVQCSTEVMEHRDRVQQRLSPQSSPNTSPSMSYASRSSTSSISSSSSISSNNSSGHNTPKSRRAIPIIDPSNMAPVSVPNHHYMMKSSGSPTFAQQQQQQFYNYNVLVQ